MTPPGLDFTSFTKPAVSSTFLQPLSYYVFCSCSSIFFFRFRFFIFQEGLQQQQPCLSGWIWPKREQWASGRDPCSEDTASRWWCSFPSASLPLAQRQSCLLSLVCLVALVKWLKLIEMDYYGTAEVQWVDGYFRHSEIQVNCGPISYYIFK